MDRHSVCSGDGESGDNLSFREVWRPGLDPRDEAELDRAVEDPSAIVEASITEADSLGSFSVLNLLLNRMIGSGIFNSSFAIYRVTQSIGGTMWFWASGATVALTGVVLYIELGLTIPRWTLRDGRRISTPRSGAELPYFNYLVKTPKYLASCVFGISFLVFGNTATNSIAFAAATLQASNATLTAARVAGIAIAANTFCCLLHSMSRKAGVYLNNFFGSVKLVMLLIMVLFGLIWLDKSVASANFDSSTAFSSTNSPKGVYSYAEAAIVALFPFGGFHQANYVLAEIKQPRRVFARTAGFGVLFICCLFTVINVLYAAVVPKDILFDTQVDAENDPLFEYFKRTIGHVTSGDGQTRAIWGSFKALSAIGNVVVFTFTAARVKQEIAKEGILPLSRYIASSYSFSFRHGFRKLSPGTQNRFFHTDKAPAAALALHWTMTVILIIAVVFGTAQMATFNYVPAYSLLVTANTFGLDTFWFACIGVGVLYLRLWPGSTWRNKSPIPHAASIAAAIIFTALNMFPLICIWVPSTTEKFLAVSNGIVPWFASQTTTVAIIAASVLYWFGFRFYLHQKKTRSGLERQVVKNPMFARDPRSGEILQIYEIIWYRWRALDAGPGDMVEIPQQ